MILHIYLTKITIYLYYLSKHLLSNDYYVVRIKKRRRGGDYLQEKIETKRKEKQDDMRKNDVQQLEINLNLKEGIKVENIHKLQTCGLFVIYP